MKPDNPIVYNEFYLDAMTGGSSELPAPVTPEQHYLAHLAGMAVTLPQPIILRDMFLAKICGMDVDIPTYIPGKFPRKFAYYAKAAGQDVEIPQPVTREEMYWFDYVNGQPTPSEQEYTGAVPVTFTANGQPLLDYLISGNTVQNGTPTPTDPIQPQETGERTGNLCPPLTEWVDGYINSGTGTIHTPTETREKSSDFIRVEPNSVYVFSHEDGDFPSGDSGAWRVVGLYDVNKQFISRIGSVNPSYLTITATAETAYIRLSFRTYGESKNAMLNEGNIALPYEPYGYKIPISSANTTTPVYLGEVETTRKIKKIVLTGEETISSESSMFYIQNIPRTYDSWSEALCTHFINARSYNECNNSASGIGKFGVSNRATTYSHLWFNKSGFETADFKSYLAQQYAAGTPVTVWYVLATETTGIVNEPLMKIGDYADTLSMEQAGVSIPTANGSTTLDVETTVKPSEVYIKYRGEAVATLSALPAEVSSPEETTEEVNPEETEEEENGSEDVSLQHELEAVE